MPYIPPLPVRSVLPRGEEPPAGLGAYGYVLFSRRPSEETKGIYSAVCEAFLRNLDPAEDHADTPRESLMVTFWPVKAEVPSDSCRELLSRYDYARALELVSALGMLDSKGPILAAWPSRDGPRNPDEAALVVDLSYISGNADELDTALGIWRTRIVRNPAVWSRGINVELARESFRAFLDRYGESFMKAIPVVKDIFSRIPEQEQRPREVAELIRAVPDSGRHRKGEV